MRNENLKIFWKIREQNSHPPSFIVALHLFRHPSVFLFTLKLTFIEHFQSIHLSFHRNDSHFCYSYLIFVILSYELTIIGTTGINRFVTSTIDSWEMSHSAGWRRALEHWRVGLVIACFMEEPRAPGDLLPVRWRRSKGAASMCLGDLSVLAQRAPHHSSHMLRSSHCTMCLNPCAYYWWT